MRVVLFKFQLERDDAKCGDYKTKASEKQRAVNFVFGISRRKTQGEGLAG